MGRVYFPAESVEKYVLSDCSYPEATVPSLPCQKRRWYYLIAPSRKLQDQGSSNLESQSKNVFACLALFLVFQITKESGKSQDQAPNLRLLRISADGRKKLKDSPCFMVCDMSLDRELLHRCILFAFNARIFRIYVIFARMTGCSLLVPACSSQNFDF